MFVRDVMTSGVDVADPGSTLAEIARRMRDANIGFMPVGEDGVLIGTVTDRDIVLRGVADAKDVTATPVRDAMSPKVFYCFEDEAAEDAARNMGQHQVRRLPVVDREKRVIGVVSIGDLSRAALDGKLAATLEDISKSDLAE
jgi:CBS domain-containing protein